MDRTASTVWGIHAGETGEADSLFLGKGVIRRRQALGRIEELRPQVRPHPRTLPAGL